MKGVLEKQADEIGPADVSALIAENVPEGPHIEFKRCLSEKSSNSNASDTWMNGGDRIGEEAKNKILEGVTAFANSYGGALVLGVEEGGGNPPVAAKMTPLPRCADLAARFREIFRDRVEPELPMLEIIPVPTDGDEGAIVFRTDRSPVGPHRVRPKGEKATGKCPVRRDDRCEALSMHEIRDFAVNLARGKERTERRLQERARTFERKFKIITGHEDAFGFRVTALPVGDDVRIDPVYADGSLPEELHPPEVSVNRTSRDWESGLEVNQGERDKGFQNWRPMLRAAFAESRTDYTRSFFSVVQKYEYAELHADGLLEWGFVSQRLLCAEPRKEATFRIEELVRTMARLLVWADRVRQGALVPYAEYAVHPQFRVTAGPVRVVSREGEHPVGSISQNDTDFPLYPLTISDEIAKNVALFERDFWNYIGVEPDRRSRELSDYVQA